MKKWMILLVALVPLALVFGCNKPKPIKLDYTEKMEQGLYDPQGLPGESHIGAPPEDFKHHGYHPGEGEEAADSQVDASKHDSSDKEKDEPEKQPDPDEEPGESGEDPTD